jgi:hypothetical protein
VGGGGGCVGVWGGRFPREEGELLKLPGVGKYTAGVSYVNGKSTQEVAQQSFFSILPAITTDCLLLLTETHNLYYYEKYE